VAGTEGPEEARNHNQGPYCARYEVGLLLLVLAFGWLFGELEAVSMSSRRHKDADVQEESLRPWWRDFRGR
jgi:hypothetical protein